MIALAMVGCADTPDSKIEKAQEIVQRQVAEGIQVELDKNSASLHQGTDEDFYYVCGTARVEDGSTGRPSIQTQRVIIKTGRSDYRGLATFEATDSELKIEFQNEWDTECH